MTRKKENPNKTPCLHLGLGDKSRLVCAYGHVLKPMANVLLPENGCREINWTDRGCCFQMPTGEEDFMSYVAIKAVRAREAAKDTATT